MNEVFANQANAFGDNDELMDELNELEGLADMEDMKIGEGAISAKP